MDASKYRIMGSDYPGVFATATDQHVFTGARITEHSKHVLAETLKVDCIDLTVSGSDLVGLFSRANSNGIVLSNLVLEEELERFKRHRLGINIEVLDSGLNALGGNILANDRIAIVNPDFSQTDMDKIRDTLGVDVVPAKIDGFKTVGSNNILTNKGLVINNRATDSEKEEWDRICGFESVRTTANTGSLAVGLASVSNSNGVLMGNSTTGFELARIMEALE